MKKFLALAFFSSVLSFAHEGEHEEASLEESPVVLAGIHEIEKYKKYFEEEGAVLGKELVGFKSNSAENSDAINAYVFNLPQNDLTKVQNSKFDCHFHGNEEHCVETEALNQRAYNDKGGVFSVEEFKKAAKSSLELLKEAELSPQRIKVATYWRTFHRNERFIQLVYQLENEAGEVSTVNIHCHEHGEEGEIDCHAGRILGALEP